MNLISIRRSHWAGLFSDTRGNGSVLGITIVAASVCGALMIAVIFSAILMVVQLQNAADSAAIAAADAQRGITEGVPCALAEELAAQLDVRMTRCVLAGLDMRVAVQKTILGFDIERTAQAGPPE